MITEPSARELLDGVIVWLDGEATAAPGSFPRRVARNALAIVAREMALSATADRAAIARLRELLGVDGDRRDLEDLLVAKLHEGSMSPDDPALLDHLILTALDTLAIDQPRYAHELPKGHP